MSDVPWEIHVCQTKGWASPIIEGATGGKYTHSYLTTASHSYSMEPTGLVRREFGYWGDDNPHSEFRLDSKQKMRVNQFLTAHALAKYDYPGDVLVGIDDLTPPFLDPVFHRIEAWRTQSGAQLWFCSAFTDAAFTYAGVKVFDDGRPFGGVTPMDLYRLFLSKGWVG